jgi:hypothetical protein
MRLPPHRDRIFADDVAVPLAILEGAAEFSRALRVFSEFGAMVARCFFNWFAVLLVSHDLNTRIQPFDNSAASQYPQ